jgi:methenyltetrahydromethanopterin cyclohydrolase
MAKSPGLNERAWQLADQLAVQEEELRIHVENVGGARVIDCGIKVPGGLQAGLGMVRVCLAGMGEAAIVAGDIGGLPCPQIQVSTDQPVAACMASQYAGWQISVGKFFAMGSGPMRAAYGKEALFDAIGNRERAGRAVGVLETRKLPDEAVIAYLSQHLGLDAAALTLLAAPAASLAGTIQVVGRSVETALHKLHELKFNLDQVVSGVGTAPLPPVAAGEIEAIGRTNDAILYGGRVTLWVSAEDDSVAQAGPKVPSCASPDHGEPFAAIFERSGKDFYKIDPMLFSPAQVVFHNVKTGRSQAFGRLEPAILKESFFGAD